MSPEFASFAVGLFGLVVFFLLNLLVLRLPGPIAPVNRQTLLALLVHVVTMAVAISLIPNMTYWHGAALYWMGFNCNLYAFSAVYKSISLRTLDKLAHAPDQSLVLKRLAEDHVRPSFADRATLLVRSGLAQEQEELFAITAKGQQLADRISLVQRLFGIQTCGLYTLSR